MISVYVRCSDGLEGGWVFDVLPRLGEIVTLRRPFGTYQVVKVEHYPVPEGDASSDMERGVSLRLQRVDSPADISRPLDAHRE